MQIKKTKTFANTNQYKTQILEDVFNYVLIGLGHNMPSII